MTRTNSEHSSTAVDVVVLGGGAAGLMCALTAGFRGRRVVVIESSNKIGKKILMSGGGRCNFTNLYVEPARFLSANPHFCISALSRYTQHDFIALVEKHGIPYHEKAEGQLFCDRSSRDILSMLAEECAQADVSILTNCTVTSVSQDSGYRVTSDKGVWLAESLVVATGGLSIPKMGASDFGYRLARQFDLRVLQTRAGLVPFTFTGAMQAMTTRLSGVSTRATLITDATTFSGDILFTHRGLSGPATLQISSYWSPGEALTLCLLPDEDLREALYLAKRERRAARLRTVLNDRLPKALVAELQQAYWPAFAEKPLAELPDEILGAVAKNLQGWLIRPAATEGYRTAEVTLGGLDTGELSSKTMECRRHPGLFFIGEVVDVTGHLGGFNFQWAWSSAVAAGQAA